LFAIVNCFKAQQNHLRTHKTWAFIDNVSYRYFENQLKAITK
jgi:hypothetical protein